jgi:hypothetical protein
LAVKANRPSAESPKSAEFVCPECGRSFTRAAALGAHRSRVHGVAGASAQSKNRAAKRSRRNGNTSKAAAATAIRASRPRPTRTRQAKPASKGADRDALLRTLFPQGIPAKQEIIGSLNIWLEEADRLSRLR